MSTSMLRPRNLSPDIALGMTGNVLKPQPRKKVVAARRLKKNASPPPSSPAPVLPPASEPAPAAEVLTPPPAPAPAPPAPALAPEEHLFIKELQEFTKRTTRSQAKRKVDPKPVVTIESGIESPKPRRSPSMIKKKNKKKEKENQDHAKKTSPPPASAPSMDSTSPDLFPESQPPPPENQDHEKTPPPSVMGEEEDGDEPSASIDWSSPDFFPATQPESQQLPPLPPLQPRPQLIVRPAFSTSWLADSQATPKPYPLLLPIRKTFNFSEIADKEEGSKQQLLAASTSLDSSGSTLENQHENTDEVQKSAEEEEDKEKDDPSPSPPAIEEVQASLEDVTLLSQSQENVQVDQGDDEVTQDQFSGVDATEEDAEQEPGRGILKRDREPDEENLGGDGDQDLTLRPTKKVKFSSVKALKGVNQEGEEYQVLTPEECLSPRRLIPGSPSFLMGKPPPGGVLFPQPERQLTGRRRLLRSTRYGRSRIQPYVPLPSGNQEGIRSNSAVFLSLPKGTGIDVPLFSKARDSLGRRMEQGVPLNQMKKNTSSAPEEVVEKRQVQALPWTQDFPDSDKQEEAKEIEGEEKKAEEQGKKNDEPDALPPQLVVAETGVNIEKDDENQVAQENQGLNESSIPSPTPTPTEGPSDKVRVGLGDADSLHLMTSQGSINLTLGEEFQEEEDEDSFVSSQPLSQTDFEDVPAYAPLQNCSVPIKDKLLARFCSTATTALLHWRERLASSNVLTVGDLCSLSPAQVVNLLPLRSSRTCPTRIEFFVKVMIEFEEELGEEKEIEQQPQKQEEAVPPSSPPLAPALPPLAPALPPLTPEQSEKLLEPDPWTDALAGVSFGEGNKKTYNLRRSKRIPQMGVKQQPQPKKAKGGKGKKNGAKEGRVIATITLNSEDGDKASQSQSQDPGQEDNGNGEGGEQGGAAGGSGSRDKNNASPIKDENSSSSGFDSVSNSFLGNLSMPSQGQATISTITTTGAAAASMSSSYSPLSSGPSQSQRDVFVFGSNSQTSSQDPSSAHARISSFVTDFLFKNGDLGESARLFNHFLSEYTNNYVSTAMRIASANNKKPTPIPERGNEEENSNETQ